MLNVALTVSPCQEFPACLMSQPAFAPPILRTTRLAAKRQPADHSFSQYSSSNNRSAAAPHVGRPQPFDQQPALIQCASFPVSICLSWHYSLKGCALRLALPHPTLSDLGNLLEIRIGFPAGSQTRRTSADASACRPIASQSTKVKAGRRTARGRFGNGHASGKLVKGRGGLFDGGLSNGCGRVANRRS